MPIPNRDSTFAVVALLPEGRVGGFLRAVAGPSDWCIPDGCKHRFLDTLAEFGHDHLFPAPGATAHARLAFTAFMHTLMGGHDRVWWGRERARRWGRELPTWLPVTDGCIVRMALDPAWPAAHSPTHFSIPQLVPLDHTLFQQIYGAPNTWKDGAAPLLHSPGARGIDVDILGQSRPYTPIGKPSVTGLSDLVHSAVVFRFQAVAPAKLATYLLQVALRRALTNLGLPCHHGIVLARDGTRPGKGHWAMRVPSLSPGQRNLESKIRGLMGKVPGYALDGDIAFPTSTTAVGQPLRLAEALPDFPARVANTLLMQASGVSSQDGRLLVEALSTVVL